MSEMISDLRFGDFESSFVDESGSACVEARVAVKNVSQRICGDRLIEFPVYETSNVIKCERSSFLDEM
jgi:hypothetical protein